MEDSTVKPKELEILPIRLVQAALQRGVLSQDAANDVDWSAAAAINKQLAKYAPKYRRFSRDAISTLNRAASLFVLYIVSIAQEHAKSKKRTTVYDKDIMEALKQGLFWEIEREMSEEMLKIYEEMRDKEAKASVGMDGGSVDVMVGEDNDDVGDVIDVVEEDDIVDVVDVDVDEDEEDVDEVEVEDDNIDDDDDDTFNENTQGAESMEHYGYTATLGDSNVIDVDIPEQQQQQQSHNDTYDEGGMELVHEEQSQGTITEHQQNINTQYS